MQRIRHLFDWLRARLWFLPALMSAVALACAFLLLWGGPIVAVPGAAPPWWLFSGDAGTARDLLSTLLSGIITMTALVVSITIVVLSLAAGQLGPRLIWNFIGDRQIQAVIGLFLATILYTLLILRSITEELGPGHVPHLAVTAASAMAVACMFALLFHVNKLARSIVSDTIVQEVADRLDAAIAGLPQSSTDGDERRRAAENGTDDGAAIGLHRSGYVQFIAYGDLCDLATRHDARLRLHVGPGEFVVRGTSGASVVGRAQLSDEACESVRRAIVVGQERTPTQDLDYAVRQLVEIAVRALSPSLNDPFTAIAVIDRMASALESLSRHDMPPSVFRDQDGRIRVVAKVRDFGDMLETGIAPLRRLALPHVEVFAALARRLSDLAFSVPPARRAAIVTHLHILKRMVARVPEPEDRSILLALIEPGLPAGLRDPAADPRHLDERAAG